MEKANAFEWAIHFGYRFKDVVIDPDGWNRKNLAESLLEEIDVQEFYARLTECTVDLRKYREIVEQIDLPIN